MNENADFKTVRTVIISWLKGIYAKIADRRRYERWLAVLIGWLKFLYARRTIVTSRLAILYEKRVIAIGWLKLLYEKRYLISTQIYLAFAVAVALTLAASFVGWLSFDRVSESQSKVNEVSVPEMTASFRIAQKANTLMSAGPELASTKDTTNYNSVSKEISSANQELVQELAVLQGRHSDEEAFDRMRGYVDVLTENVYTIQTGMVESFQRQAQLESFDVRITDVNEELDELLTPIEDDLSSKGRTGFSEAEFAQYLLISEIRSDLASTNQILASSFGITDASAIEPLKDPLFETKWRILNNLNEIGDADLVEEAEPLVVELFDFGIGEQGSLALLEAEAGFLVFQQTLISENRGVAANLIKDVETFVNAANDSVEGSVLEVGQAVNAGRLLLLIISGASVCGAALIVWLLVGRVLLRRLQMMLEWMRRMADGDLEATVEIGGRDEVANMGAALEVFRQNSLEAQRLNLVEKMAAELQDKNLELERVLKELEQAQDQIVMREKLAALGELTAGVAHEIRNPLNFINNFSEASEELLDEMGEILEEVRDDLDEEQRDYIEEVSGDLVANMNRIRSHGERANRIVNDMLMMGRESSDNQKTDINGLLDQYSGLAYHSARAADPDFQLHIERDFDESVGELDVRPQELGRVFLNMVSNACDATEEKRRMRVEAGDGGSYMPTLNLVTRRMGNAIQVRVRDNGNGIPEDIVDRIFNPFFTTKPSGKGTGLGLAMSNDIVREHGGSISVETKSGESTEMIVELPISNQAAVL